MRSDEGRDELDRRIDAALRSYAEPGEIPEARVVLARVMERAGAERRRLRWWIGAVGSGAAAVVLLAVAVVWGMRSAQAPEIAWVPRAPGVVAIPVRSADGVAESHPGAREAAVDQREVALPKQAVFPTPRPLTAEEQALVAFVNRAPADLRQAVIEDQQNWDKPIVIAGVTVRPLSEGEEPNDQRDEKQNQESNPER